MLALYLIYHCNHHIHTFACRTFDVNDTGRISESKFRQILATKQVPEDDVEGILEGENTSPQILIIFGCRIPKAGCGSKRHQQRWRFWGADSLQRSFKWWLRHLNCQNEKNIFPELIRMLQAPPPDEGWTVDVEQGKLFSEISGRLCSNRSKKQNNAAQYIAKCPPSISFYRLGCLLSFRHTHWTLILVFSRNTSCSPSYIFRNTVHYPFEPWWPRNEIYINTKR